MSVRIYLSALVLTVTALDKKSDVTYRVKIFTAKDAKSAKLRRKMDSELNTNSYELWFKYFQQCGAPIETDAGYVYRKYKPQISRNFGLRSVGVCCAYPSFDKPFLKVYADERRF